jgi:preprotein translocase subunit YajC
LLPVRLVFSANYVTMPDLSALVLLAQEATKPAGDAPAAQPPGLSSLLPAFALIAVFFYFLVLRPQRSKDQQFRSLVENLKDKDRVVTIGGIHGVVTNVDRREGREAVVVIRVDDASGAKIRVNASAISRVVSDEQESTTS